MFCKEADLQSPQTSLGQIVLNHPQSLQLQKKHNSSEAYFTIQFLEPVLVLLPGKLYGSYHILSISILLLNFSFRRALKDDEIRIDCKICQHNGLQLFSSTSLYARIYIFNTICLSMPDNREQAPLQTLVSWEKQNCGSHMGSRKLSTSDRQ